MTHHKTWSDLTARFREISTRPGCEPIYATYVPARSQHAESKTVHGGSGESDCELFRSVAAIAAGELLDRPDWTAWLDLLREHSPDFRPILFGGYTRSGKRMPERRGGFIQDVREVSARMCIKLESGWRPPGVAPAQTAENGTAFPNRAAWLRERMHERTWTASQVQDFGGPDHKTVARILAGKPVFESSLETLVKTLSDKGNPVRLSDIPRA